MNKLQVEDLYENDYGELVLLKEVLENTVCYKMIRSQNTSYDGELIWIDKQDFILTHNKVEPE